MTPQKLEKLAEQQDKLTPKQIAAIKRDLKRSQKWSLRKRARYLLALASLLTTMGMVGAPVAKTLAKAASAKEDKTSQVTSAGDITSGTELAKFLASMEADETFANSHFENDGKDNGVFFEKSVSKTSEGQGYNQLDKLPDERGDGTYYTANNVAQRTVISEALGLSLEVINITGERHWSIISQNKDFKGHITFYYTAGQDNNNSFRKMTIQIKGPGVYTFDRGTGKTGVQSVYLVNSENCKDEIGVQQYASLTLYQNHHIALRNRLAELLGDSYNGSASQTIETLAKGTHKQEFDEIYVGKSYTYDQLGVSNNQFPELGHEFLHWSDQVGYTIPATPTATAAINPDTTYNGLNSDEGRITFGSSQINRYAQWQRVDTATELVVTVENGLPEGVSKSGEIPIGNVNFSYTISGNMITLKTSALNIYNDKLTLPDAAEIVRLILSQSGSASGIASVSFSTSNSSTLTSTNWTSSQNNEYTAGTSGGVTLNPSRTDSKYGLLIGSGDTLGKYEVGEHIKFSAKVSSSMSTGSTSSTGDTGGTVNPDGTAETIAQRLIGINQLGSKFEGVVTLSSNNSGSDVPKLQNKQGTDMGGLTYTLDNSDQKAITITNSNNFEVTITYALKETGLGNGSAQDNNTYTIYTMKIPANGTHKIVNASDFFVFSDDEAQDVIAAFTESVTGNIGNISYQDLGTIDPA